MEDKGKRLHPVRSIAERDYPSYEGYRRDRRRVLRWLGAGGAALATAGLVGCDRIRDVLGMSQPQAPLAGTIACPTPPQPVGAGEGTETETEGETETETKTETETEAEGETETGAQTVTPDIEARPDAHMRGDIAAPEPVAVPDAPVPGGMAAPNPVPTQTPDPARPAKTGGKIKVVNPNEPKSEG
ncbi:MAG: hypothetical protein QGH45_23110 [Myxococcota bacterium]|jgi:hypothetical protein|nr:hypothetical protein [Myxococcota bacterium]